MKRQVTLKNVKGSYDFLPEEQKIRNYIQDTLKKVFEEYGYKPLETPILCYYDLLAGKYDESNDLLNEIYKLSDQGKRELGLRYDLTVPFAKCISMIKDLRLPFKRYEIGKVFRDGPVKLGRDREFLQCDVDVVGLNGQVVEAELISLWLKGYSELGIESYVKYNSRNLMRGLIMEQGISDDEQIGKIVTVIDKIDKIDKKELIKELGEIGFDEVKAQELLKYFEMSFEEIYEKFNSSQNEMLQKGLDELKNLKEILDKIGVGNDAVFSPSLARGQDYYTGNVFEVYDKNGKLTCSIGGGGRYDKMITDFIGDGKEYPAVGVSFGLTSIYELLKDSEKFKNKSLIDLYIIPMEREAECLRLANEIRSLGINADVEMSGRKIKKCFEFANRENIPYVIVIGDNEAMSRRFKLKDMTSGEETEVSFDDIEILKDIIKRSL